MNITLYQVNPTRGKDSLFMSLAWLREKGMAVDPSIYDKVWDGEVDASDLERTSPSSMRITGPTHIPAAVCQYPTSLGWNPQMVRGSTISATP